MKSILWTHLLIALLGITPCLAADKRQEVFFLRFPLSEEKALGQIDRLHVAVACSWISGLRSVPELYNVQMGYDMPTVNELEIRPRLGAAGVDLSHWIGVIGVRIPQDADAKSCFDVTVIVEGRTGEKRKWTGRQLGFTK